MSGQLLRTQPKGIRVVNWITVGVAIEIEPTGDPNGVFLGEMPNCPNPPTSCRRNNLQSRKVGTVAGGVTGQERHPGDGRVGTDVEVWEG